MLCKVYQRTKYFGYLCGNVFIPLKVVDFLLSSKPICNAPPVEATIITKSNITLHDGTIIPCITSLLYGDNIDYIRESLQQEGLKLKTIIYLRIKEVCEEHKSKLSSFWSYYKADSPNMYEVYNTEKEETMGYLLLRNSLYDNEKCSVIMFEVLDKGTGYGRDIIHDLTKYRILDGLSVYKAIDFWKKCGADVAENGNFSLKSY